MGAHATFIIIHCLRKKVGQVEDGDIGDAERAE